MGTQIRRDSFSSDKEYDAILQIVRELDGLIEQVSSLSAGVTDHGSLTGLTDDDHTQYVLRNILTADGDLFTRAAGAIARLGVGSAGQVLTVAAGAPSWQTPSAGVTDHGLLSGLGDDDHPQYVLRSILSVDGDIFIRSGAAVTRLGLGAADTYLGSTGGLPAWRAQSTLDHGSLGGLGDDDHPQYPLAGSTETISGAWTFSARMRLDSNFPEFVINDADSGANARKWRLLANLDTLTWQTLNDIENTGETFLSIVRAATSASISTLTLSAGSGSMTLQAIGSLDLAGSTIDLNNQVRFSNGVWNQSLDGRNRLFFSSNDRTLFGSFNGYEWRSAADANLMNLLDTGRLLLVDGSAANPSLSNIGDENTGFYWSAANEISGVSDGNIRLVIHPGGISMLGTDTAPTYNGTDDIIHEGNFATLLIGYRDIPRRTSGFARGECLSISAGVTLNTSDMVAGRAFSIYNNSGSSITITQGSGVTLRLAGTATTGNRTMAARSFATIWCESGTEAVMGGAGVT